MIAVDDVGSGFANASSVTITDLVVGSGADRAIIVIVAGYASAAGATTSVTRNSGAETFTEVQDFQYPASGNEMHMSLHYLVNPAAGSYTINVTCSGTLDELWAGAIALTGVHQATPIGTEDHSSGTSANSSGIAPAADDADLIVDGILVDIGTIAAGADQTERVNRTDDALSFGMSTQPGSVAGDEMTWTFASAKWIGIAVPVKSGVIARNPVPMGFVVEI